MKAYHTKNIPEGFCCSNECATFFHKLGSCKPLAWMHAIQHKQKLSANSRHYASIVMKGKYWIEQIKGVLNHSTARFSNIG